MLASSGAHRRARACARPKPATWQLAWRLAPGYLLQSAVSLWLPWAGASRLRPKGARHATVPPHLGRIIRSTWNTAARVLGACVQARTCGHARTRAPAEAGTCVRTRHARTRARVERVQCNGCCPPACPTSAHLSICLPTFPRPFAAIQHNSGVRVCVKALLYPVLLMATAHAHVHTPGTRHAARTAARPAHLETSHWGAIRASAGMLQWEHGSHRPLWCPPMSRRQATVPR